MSSPDPLALWTGLSDLVLRTTIDLGQLVVEQFDLPLKAVHVLFRLRDGPVRITELADGVYLSTSGASRAGDLLFRRRLVERLSTPGDGRATTLALTLSGREVADAARQALALAVGRVLADPTTIGLLRSVRAPA